MGAKAEREKPLTSLRKTFSNQKGLTLIEIMIVVGIIAAVISVALPRIGNRNNQMKAAVRRLTVLSRQLHHLAKLNNATYRLVIDFGDDSEQRELGENEVPQRYWVEKSTKLVRLTQNMEKKIELDRERDAKLKKMTPEERKKAQQEPPDGFDVDASIFKKKQSLPGSLRFRDIEFAGLKTNQDSGKAYIHYLPEGYAQESALHLFIPDTKITWTLVVHPMTGKMDISTEDLKLESIRDQR